MDFDSSTKFISSLAKFLQSLCNGYVEFNNGVEVIGHIYINVDTGKKIDYILNEKVCKTDENSVTFISNSFHAQPAEKPKPPGKHPGTTESSKLSDSGEAVDEEEIIIMEEPESKNVGTVPTRDSFHRSHASPLSKQNRPPKRSYHQSFSSGHLRHSSKQSRSELSTSGPNGIQQDTDSLHSESNSSSNILPSHLSGDSTLMAASESDMTHLSKVFPKTFNNSSDNQVAAEERDIKPQLDSDMNIIQVKQEFQSQHSGEDDQENFDDSQDQGSSVFPGMQYDQYYNDGSGRGQRSDYNQGAMAPEFFQGGAGPSGDAGTGDSSGAPRVRLRNPFCPGSDLWQPGMGCPVPGCSAKIFRQATHLKIHWTEKHEEIVAKYHCSMCTFFSKRRSNLFQHFRFKHGNGDISNSIKKVEYQHNHEFQDPYPLSLDLVLGKVK